MATDITATTSTVILTPDPNSFAPAIIGNPTVDPAGTTNDLLYAGLSGSSDEIHIGLATSTDGVSWTPDASNPVINSANSQSWDSYREVPITLIDDGGVYKLWFNGDNKDLVTEQGRLDGFGYATSTDNGKTWTQNSNPIISELTAIGGYDLESIVKFGGQYHAYFVHDAAGGNAGGGTLLHATSTDGINFDFTHEAPVVVGPNAAGYTLLATTSIVVNGTEEVFSIWADSSGIEHYATSTDGVNFTIGGAINGLPSNFGTKNIEIINNQIEFFGDLSVGGGIVDLAKATAPLPILDATPPTLVSSSPPDNATNVAPTTPIVLTFSEPVQAGSGNIIIQNSQTGAAFATIAVTDATQVSFAGSNVTISPAASLVASTGYDVEVASGAITDLAGNSFAGISDPTTLNFSTAAPVDTTPPTLTSSSPTDNATGVAVNSNIVLTFSEPVKTGSGAIVIRNSTTGMPFATIPVTDTSQVTFSGNNVTINPTADLAASTNYDVEVASGAITDLAGNSFTGISDPTTLNFSTAPAVQPTFVNITAEQQSILEGDVGQITPVIFDLTRGGDTSGTTTVHWAVSAASTSPTLNGQDFVGGVMPSRDIVFNPGETTKQITVQVNGDNAVEPDESFLVTLTGQGFQAGPAASVVIANDDGKDPFHNVSFSNFSVEMAYRSLDAYNNTATMTSSGWTPLDLANFDFANRVSLGSDFNNGVFNNLNASAQVYAGVVNKQKTVLIAFRGTNDAADVQNWLFLPTHYDLFNPLIKAVDKFVSDNNVKSVYVTGHSLGGAMTQFYMLDHQNVNNIVYQAATFGSPGTQLGNTQYPDNRIVNYVHTQDPVPIAGALLPVPDTYSGPEVSISRTDLNADLSDPLTLIGGAARVEHDMSGYLTSMLTLENAGAPAVMNFAPSQVAISFGSDIKGDQSSNPVTNGQVYTRDVMIGTNANDKITGGLDADILTGGPGDDIFIYRTPDDHGDTITDFTPGKTASTGDKIGIVEAGFGITGAAQLSEFSFDKKTDNLNFQAPGSAPVMIAHLNGVSNFDPKRDITLLTSSPV
jgi:methionine-rich copper-binding protein CopC